MTTRQSNTDHNRYFWHSAAPPENRIGLVVVLLSFALLFFYFYRSWLFTGLDGVFGDRGDARILIAILEHWHRWFSGHASHWTDPDFFFPERGVLGFTDAYFLYAIPYSIARAAGIDPFRAFMCVMFLLSLIGTSTFYVLARRCLSASVLTAIAGVGLFAFSNMMAVKIGHAQSYCAMLLPSVILLLLAALDNVGRLPGVILAASSGLLLALIFFTAFLTAWFATTFALLAFLIYVGIGGRSRIVALYRSIFGERWYITFGFVIGFTIGLVPFLMLYVPVLLEGKARSFDEVLMYPPRFADILNTGSDNIAWGRLLKSLGIAGIQGRSQLGEVELGYTPIFFATMIATTLALVNTEYRKAARIGDVGLALGLAVILYWLVQLEWFGYRPWHLVWQFIPGAKGVRTTFRSQIVGLLPSCIVIVIGLELLRRQLIIKSWAGWILPVLAVWLLAEQLNRKAPPRFWRSEQMAWLSSLPPPPADCRVFYLLPQSSGTMESWELQSDAMIVSAVQGLPTLNGNSSWQPKGWQLNDPGDPLYAAKVGDWVRGHNINEKDICGLNDVVGGTWRPGLP